MRVPFLFSGLLLTVWICNSNIGNSISPRIWLRFTKMTAATATYYLTTSKLPTSSSKASSTKIRTISFTNSPLIQWKKNMMLAALPVQWHCFETGKVSDLRLLQRSVYCSLRCLQSYPEAPQHSEHTKDIGQTKRTWHQTAHKKGSLQYKLHKLSYSKVAAK